ncbi:hypothetical protein [Neorhodopirellula pilleata]|nr:hypothetical protein [Neorhodopirellula pilleata]
MKRFFPGTGRARPRSTRLRRPTGRRPGQSLQFQSLESRRLLAVAAFETELLQDNNGVPGEVIADNTVIAGETFFLRITAQEFDTFRSGIRAAAVNVDWDSGLLNVVEEDFDLREVLTEDFPLFQYAELKNETGSLHDLSGGAMLSWQAGRAIGDEAPETFAIIRMQAGPQSGTASIELSKSRVKTTLVPTVVLAERHIRFDSETITIVPAAQAVVAQPTPTNDAIPEISEAPEVPESPVVPEVPSQVVPVVESAAAVDQVMSFDMNQDGVFDLGDFGLLNSVDSAARPVERTEAEPVSAVAIESESDSTNPASPTAVAMPALLHTCLAFPEGADDAATEAWLDAFATAWIADAEARQRRREQAGLF